MAVFRVDKTRDYTVMSNHHLRNPQISLKAKGLLSLMLSLPEEWDYSLNGLAIISMDGLSSIRSAVLELEQAGYLRRRRLRNDKGQLTETEYTILEKPETLATQVSEPKCDFPILDNPTLEKPMLEKPTLENRTQLNIDIINTDESNIYQLSIDPSINPAISAQHADPMDSMEELRRRIHFSIDYNHLVKTKSQVRVDELVQLMLDAVSTKSPTIRIGGSDMSTSAVKNRFLTLKHQHIEYVLECLERNTSSIRNIKSYLLTALYNAPTTIENYYHSAVNHDLYGGY